MSFTPLKFIYDKTFYNNFLSKLKEVVPTLNIEEFYSKIFNSEWKNRELKNRMKHTSFVLNKYLDRNFEKASNQILQLIKIINLEDYKYGSLAFMFLPDYIETYGIKYFDVSMATFEKLTEFTSCEFAVRPFIIQNQKKSFKILLQWSKNKNHHVRRLSSECCRPKLPWAVALKSLQKDPSPILPILENLKNDKEDYVYRSVANNLNDISKNHPKLVLKIANTWNGKSKNTDWVVKHGLRTLLKKGNQDAMKIFGYGDENNYTISCFNIVHSNIKIGESLEFSFVLNNSTKAKNRLEYAIYFLRKNGKYSKKVFKISEKEYLANTISKIEKRHSFRIISSRKYYAGMHELSVIINGVERTKCKFYLECL